MGSTITKPGGIIRPWAENGARNTLAVESQIAITAGVPSYNDGWVSLNSVAPTAGGVAVKRLDFNGLFYDITANSRWTNAGGQARFDSNLAAEIGGYPVGAILQSDDGTASYINVLDGNSTDFNSTPASIGVSWIPYGSGYSHMAVFTTTGATVDGTAISWTNGGTWTIPAARIRVRGCGGGGAGGYFYTGGGNSSRSSGCGAGGGSFEGVYIVTKGTTVAITIGAGGTANNSSTIAGGAGGTTSFGTLCTATGGHGGGGNDTNAAGGLGGTATGGMINIQGGDGCDGVYSSNGASGTGGDSQLGHGGRSGADLGFPGRGHGGGGGGAYGNSSCYGSNGSDGVLIAEW